MFSDRPYSQRQLSYDRTYAGPKDHDYGRYDTPMLMIDGKQPFPSAAGPPPRPRWRPGALTRKPAVQLDVALALEGDGRSGTATITVASRSPQAERSSIPVCAVLREDGVVTDIP